MKKLLKYLPMVMMSLFLGVSSASDQINYSPNKPVDKVNKSLSMVEKKVRGAAVKVVTATGHGSGTVVQYKDLTLVLTARHVADGVLGRTYLVANESEQRSGTLIFQSREHDIAVLVVSTPFRYLKAMPWKPTKDYSVGTDIVYSGHPSWHKLMSFNGRIVGYEDIAGSGTQLIVNTYGWFGCSGSGVYNTNGELVGILYGVDVQYAYGTQIQENLIWVAPITNLDIKSSLDAFCRGSIKNYKACR